jgi:hypothetical protein
METSLPMGGVLKTLVLTLLFFTQLCSAFPWEFEGEMKVEDIELEMRRNHPHKIGYGAREREWKNQSLEEAQALTSNIKKVHVIFMNHLDVGYNGIFPEIGKLLCFLFVAPSSFFSFFLLEFQLSLSSTHFLFLHRIRLQCHQQVL